MMEKSGYNWRKDNLFYWYSNGDYTVTKALLWKIAVLEKAPC
jgi:hypothetical protein